MISLLLTVEIARVCRQTKEDSGRRTHHYGPLDVHIKKPIGAWRQNHEGETRKVRSAPATELAATQALIDSRSDAVGIPVQAPPFVKRLLQKMADCEQLSGKVREHCYRHGQTCLDPNKSRMNILAKRYLPQGAAENVQGGGLRP